MASLKFLSRYSLCFSICTDCFSSGNTAGQAVRCGHRRALLRGGGHGTAGHPLLAGTDRHCGGVAGTGSPGTAGRGLGTAGDVCGVFHLFGQHGAD